MDTLTNNSARRDTSGRVVAGPLSWEPPARPNKSKWGLIGGPIIVLGVMLYLVNLITLPYVMLAPGGADAINQLVKVPSDKSFKPKGSFLLTTVSLQSNVHLSDLFYDWLDDDTKLFDKKELLGDSSQQQYNQVAIQDMRDSKEDAAVVAFRSLGYPITEHGSGALVTAVAPGDAPVTGVLEPGDAITAIDGVATLLRDDAIKIIRQHTFGESLVLDVLKADGKTTAKKQVTVGAFTAEGSCSKKEDIGEGVCLGVNLATKEHSFDFPFKVSIDTQGIGGPSAGLAFALALIDELTPGELTGGKKVAVTGTIDVDGNVGDVGGVVQKTAAVRRAKASLFLVPPGEFVDAAKHAGKNLKVVKVTTLQEALAALAANGGDVPAKLAGQTAGN